MSIFLKDKKIHNSWDKFFIREDIKTALNNIENQIGNDFTPRVDLVLRFAEIDLSEVRIIIQGKDVYPQIGVATGRAFEVSGVTDWSDSAVNSSLKNITKLIHKGYSEENNDLPIEEHKASPINKVREDIKLEKFKIPTPNKAFSYWESQGVLFLNTAFTCKIGGINEAGSHLAIWKPFFTALLDYIATENPDIKYFLWGDSRKYVNKLKKKGIADENIYLAKHPCTNGDNGGYKNNSKFLNCPCFFDTMGMINWIEK